MFSRNKALYGAAVYLYRVINSTFTNSVFTDNEVAAGTIYWVNASQSDTKWPVQKPSVADCQFLSSKASVYGSSLASSFTRIITNVDSIYITDYRSLSSKPYFLKTVDAYDTVIPYFSAFSIYVDPLIAMCSLNSPTVFGNISSMLRNGNAAFVNMFVICIPGGYFYVDFKVRLPTQIDEDGYTSNLYYEKRLKINFRNCRIGEKYDILSLTKSTCSKCVDSFSMYNFAVSPAEKPFEMPTCQPCPPQARLCKSFEILIPKGSWRFGNLTSAVFPCDNPYACKGGFHVGADSCSHPYQGPLCGVCQEGYFVNNFECISCAGRVRNVILKLIGLGLIYKFLNYFDTIISNYLDDEIIGYINIVLSSSQVFSLSSFNFPDPTVTKVFSFLLDFQLDIFYTFNIPCFVAMDFYDKFMSEILFPIPIAIFVSILWLFPKLIKLENGDSPLAILILIIYYIMPMLTKTIFSIFDCIDLDPLLEVSDVPMQNTFMRVDYRLQCQGELYNTYWTLASFSVLIYPLLLPFFLFLVLYWQRNLITQPILVKKIQNAIESNIKLPTRLTVVGKIGYLYSNYKCRFWYFEIVEIYFRLFLTSLSAMIRNVDYKNMFLVLLSLIQWRVQYTLNPYKIENLNILSELGKVQVMLTTLYGYIESNSGLKVQIKNILDAKVNSSIYAVVQQGIAFVNSLQTAFCFYFIYRHVRNMLQNSENEMKLKEQMKEIAGDVAWFQVCTYHKDNSSSVVLSFAKDISINEILLVQGAMFLSLMSRLSGKSCEDLKEMRQKSIRRGDISIYFSDKVDSTIFNTDLIFVNEDFNTYNSRCKVFGWSSSFGRVREFIFKPKTQNFDFSEILSEVSTESEHFLLSTIETSMMNHHDIWSSDESCPQVSIYFDDFDLDDDLDEALSITSTSLVQSRHVSIEKGINTIRQLFHSVDRPDNNRRSQTSTRFKRPKMYKKKNMQASPTVRSKANGALTPKTNTNQPLRSDRKFYATKKKTNIPVIRRVKKSEIKSILGQFRAIKSKF